MTKPQICSCGKNKNDMNLTNWIRHTSSCKIRKSRDQSKSIEFFFNNPKKLKLELGDSISFEEKLYSTITSEAAFSSSTGSTDNVIKVINTNNYSDSTENMINDGNKVDSIILESTNIYKSDQSTNKFPNDPALYLNKTISHCLKNTLLEMGPCQPTASELSNAVFPKDTSSPSRSFSSAYYFKLVNGKTVQRNWLAYSPSTDRIYCWTCRLFGTPGAQKNGLVSSGCNAWGHLSGVYGRLHKHESCKDHLESELNRAMYMRNNRIDILTVKSSNSRVAINREVVKILMDIVLCLAKHNDAYRGHLETNKDLIQGKYRDWVTVFAKYHPILSSHLDRINSNSKRTSLTFLSKTSQNAMIESVAETIRDKILNEIKTAGMYSLILDSTTDVAKLDQFAFVFRYCSIDGTVHERFLCTDETADSTGNGMFALFCKICDHYSLNWKKQLIGQAFDGASNMQGAIKGLRSIIQKDNPNALHVWCFAHCLSLVVCDSCQANTQVRDFFSIIGSLVTFIGARKRTATYVELQKTYYPKERSRRLKHFSNTRWTYHDQSIDVILKTYKAVIETLKNIITDEIDKKTSDTAKSFLKNLNKFNFVLTMHLMKKLFSITTPLSKYLQAPDMDFIQAMKLVMNTKQQLQDMQHDLYEKDIQEKPVSLKKKMPGENQNDKRLSSAKERYISEVYNVTLDIAINKIEDRYSNSENIFNDIFFFSPEHLQNQTTAIPNSFEYICNWLSAFKIDKENLSTEYHLFASNFNNLMKDGPENISEKFPKIFDEDSDNDSILEDDNFRDLLQVSNILQKLCKMGMASAFPNLSLAYKAICTLPPTSASAERCFSKLKLIKTNLRSTMSESRLDHLMVISCNPDIDINMDDAIDKFGSRSNLLRSNLLYK
ncbi:zinc finger MYM-type protein 1-like [Melanaphis sacchari]|uniref:zinc finger MYM-type protein 1-like n=1 Tax=Melanaphis sacchari TaxID=742174 RepID=UPI000DC14E1E|nr:zinc finger MYM-type protein 1-like [Melanaphis sacchari]